MGVSQGKCAVNGERWFLVFVEGREEELEVGAERIDPNATSEYRYEARTFLQFHDVRGSENQWMFM